ncbi:MAG: hypothetical protein AB7P31_01485 [Steroidobacteraceae bacterium]
MVKERHAISEMRLYFATLKEGRDDYFVEYRPPIHGYSFATLQLIFPHRVGLVSVAEAMEREGVSWYRRFPVPIMVSAFDETGDLVRFNGVRPENYLFVFHGVGTNAVERRWCLLKSDELPSEVLNPDALLRIYSEVEYKTNAQLRLRSREQARRMRITWFAVFLWIAVAPVAFLIVEYFGPNWLAALVFGYGLLQAFKKALKLLGRWRKSAAEIASEEEERRMRHHHYHCERNPEGFLRLKMENLERESREEILREAEQLKPRSSISATKQS